MRRSNLERGLIFLATVSMSLLVAGRALGQNDSIPLPVEAVIAVEKLAEGNPIALSPGGGWVAYTIQTGKKVTSMNHETFAQTGVPPMMAGTDIWIQRIGTSAARNLTEGDGDNWNPTWSPDGRYLAFFSDRQGGIARLWIWDSDRVELRMLSDVAVIGHGLEWTPGSHELLVTLAGDQANPKNEMQTPPSDQGTSNQQANGIPKSTVRLYRSRASSSGGKEAAHSDPWDLDIYLRDIALVNVEDGEISRIIPRKRIASYQLSPDGSRIAYTIPKRFEKPGSQQTLFDLAVMDLAERQERIIGSEIRFEHDAASFSWSPDSQRLSFRTGGTEERSYDCYVASALGGSPRNVSSFPSATAASHRASIAPLWNRKGDAIYFVRDGSLWKASANGSSATEIGGIKNREIIQLIAFSGDQVWTPDGDGAGVVQTYDDEGQQDGIYKIDLTTGASAKLLEKGQCYSCANVSQHFVVTPNGQQIAFISEDAQHGQDLWISDSSFQNSSRLTQLNKQFDRYRTGEARLIRWLSDNGEPLQGALLLPANYESGKRYPLIVWVYGGVRLSNHFDHFGLASSGDLNMQLFATRGYAVLLPDAPTRAIAPMSDLAATVLPGINKAIEMGIADPDRLGVMGLSNGGYSTLSLIVESDRFKAAVDIDGLADELGFYGEMDDNGTAFATSLTEQSQGIGSLGGTPWQFRDRYIENSPIFYLDRVKTPLLIVHGTKDSIVAPFLGDEVFVGLRRLGKEVEYAKYQGEEHSPFYWSYQDQLDFANRIIEWFDLHLKEIGSVPPTIAGK
jgi:dipeptidyl aminopeptidase/acylaminoacyl peptidase